MAAWKYEISLLVLKKYFTRSLRSLVKYFSTLEEEFLISARPCNILYLFVWLTFSRMSLSKTSYTVMLLKLKMLQFELRQLF